VGAKEAHDKALISAKLLPFNRFEKVRVQIS